MTAKGGGGAKVLSTLSGPMDWILRYIIKSIFYVHVSEFAYCI